MPTKNQGAEKVEVAVKKIVVQMGRKELVLDVDEAKQLRDVLSELFGKVVTEDHHHHHYPAYPVWYPYQPYWTSNTGNYRYKDSTVYFSNANDSTLPKQPEMFTLEVRG